MAGELLMELAHLSAGTAAGEQMVAAATRFAVEFAEGAAVHDRDATFAVEHLDKLRADRYLVAPIPAGLGGGGVDSVHDVVVASSRLARGDAATAIGVNMHLSILVNTVRAWRAAVERWDDRRAETLERRLRHVAAGDVVLAAAASEPPPQDLTRPATTATRLARGWVIEGRKVFATMAPFATELVVAVTYADAHGHDRYGFATVPVASEGVVFADDWDALGMRASASGSVSFHAVEIDDSALSDGFPAGGWSPAMMDRYLVAGAFHGSVALGIAEAAHLHVLERLRARRDAVVGDPHATTELAGNVVDLVAMRGALARAGHLIDDFVAAHPMGSPPADAVQAAFAEVQAIKAFLGAAGVRVVDRALALSGGSGYRAGDPIAKAWRDVRAVDLMHPLGANRVAPVLARTALQLAP